MSGEKKKNPSTRSEPTPDSGAERFVFRDREWPTRELANEFFVLRDRMNELLDERKKSRLSDEKWRELNLVQDGLEHIGPELERRERNKRKAKRSAEGKLAEGKMTGDLNESSSGRDQKFDFLGSDPKTDEFSISYPEKLTGTIFPEGGKKTFLDEKTLGMVAELTKIRSAIHNSQERIRKRKKQGMSLEGNLKFLSTQQENRKEIVLRLQQSYVELERQLSESVSSENDRKEVQRRLMLSNAVEELGSIIGNVKREMVADEESLAKMLNDQGKVGTGASDTIKRDIGNPDGPPQPMTERQINEELIRLGWIIAESQGPIEEFETEIEDLKRDLSHEKKKLDDLKNGQGDDPDGFNDSNVKLLQGIIVRSEANISRKEADLELRRNPHSIEERIRSLERERRERFPRGAKKSDNARWEDLPAPEDDTVRLTRRAEELQSELGLHETYLEELGRERVTEAGRLMESLSKWSEQWEKIEDIKRVLTGVKSVDVISARLEEEKPVTMDSLKRIDAMIEEITGKKRSAEAELAVVQEKIGSLAAIPDGGQGDPVPEREEGVSDDSVAQSDPTAAPDDLPVLQETGTRVNGDESIGPEPSTKEELSDAVRGRFESFGISFAELASIDGFAELTEGQRLFVAEMLRQTAARKIEDRARDAVATKSGLLKSYHLATSRKDAAGKVLRGGMETFGEDIRQLAEGLKTSGLDMTETDGKFDIRFLSIPEGFEHDGSLMTEGASFNEAANRFATIPHEWSLPGASKDERKRYKEAKAAYDETYERLDGIVNRDRGLEDPKAYATLREENVALRIADNRVRLIQHLTAHPEVGKQLEKFEQQNAFLAGMKSVVAERGVYAVFGAAGRFLLGATPLGLLAAPAVASISGAIAARIRSGEALIEQDRQARRGRKTSRTPSDTSRSFDPATNAARTGKKTGLAERLDTISAKVQDLSDGDEEAKEKAIESLQARIAYTWKKIDSGLVDFGTDGMIGNQVRLEEALSNAEMTLGLFSGGVASERRLERLLSGQDGLEERMNNILDIHERNIERSRNRFKNAEAMKGAALSGTISILGAGIMHKAMEWLHPMSGPAGVSAGGRTGVPGQSVRREAIPDAARTRPIAASGRSIAPEVSTGNAVTEAGAPRSFPAANDAASGVNAPKGTGTVAETVKQVVAEKSSGGTASIGNAYLEMAKSGDSVTTLARRALAEYVRENNLSGLTPEQKVFVEDYLQKKVAREGTLRVGEKIEFTKDLLTEAFGRAKVLDADQLQNLHRYAEQVGEFRTGSSSVRSIPTGSGGDAVPVTNAPKISPVPAAAEDAASLAKGNPSTAAAGAATETGSQTGGFRDMVKSSAARDFLADPNHVEPFRKAAAGTIRELFSTSAGEVNEKLFLKVGKMTSKGVFRDCLLAVADPEKMASMDGFDAEGVRRLGKFLIAARRAGIQPEIGIGKTETFRVYIERVSVRLAEQGTDPSKLIASVSDRDLDGFAGGALEAWRNQGR